jgi:glycosyltransferase involved in cell wall biosynthesis
VRILWVKAGRLLPVDTGGKIRSFNLLRQLASLHETTTLSYYAGARDAQYETALADALPGAVSMAVGGPTSTIGTVVDYVRRIPASAPYAVTKFTSPRARDQIEAWMRAGKFDVAVCDFLSASLTFPARLTTPTALFQHNVESALWKRQAAHEANPVKKTAFMMEARKMARYEAAAVRRFHHVIAVSENDKTLMSAMVDSSRISVAPTGVDLAQYRAIAGHEASDPVVMFLGSMDWEANVDGVAYFHAEIWPRVRAAVPTATFRIVGRNPAARVLKLAEDPSVIVTGSVPSVVDHLRDAAVFVVPLRIGGGTRLKIYEAMASGRACVSTTIGAEGLDYNDGRDIVLADEPEKFADSIIAFLRDDHRRRAFEAAAAAQAARFDWPVVVRQFENSLEQTINAAASAASLTGSARS